MRNGRGGGSGMGRGRGRRNRMRMNDAPVNSMPENRRLNGTPLPAEIVQPVEHNGTRGGELNTLKIEAREMEDRLRAIAGEIRSMEAGQIALKSVPVVNPELCSACGICRDVCPQGAISVNGYAEIDPDACTACGLCAEECPRNAISMTGD